MAARLSRIIPVSLTLLAAMALSACTSRQAPALKEGEKPVDVASVVRRKMPASLKDRESVGRKPSPPRLTARSWRRRKKTSARCWRSRSKSLTISPNPVVPGLNKIAWQEIDRRAENPAFRRFWSIPR